MLLFFILKNDLLTFPCSLVAECAGTTNARRTQLRSRAKKVLTVGSGPACSDANPLRLTFLTGRADGCTPRVAVGHNGDFDLGAFGGLGGRRAGRLTPLQMQAHLLVSVQTLRRLARHRH